MGKTILIFVFVICTISLLAVTNTWQGDVSHTWSDGNNWSLGHEPLLSEDVVIPNVGDYPYITATTGYNTDCRSVEIQSGAMLRIGYGMLTVTYDVTVYGSIWMSSENAILDVNDDIFWKTGSSETINYGIIYVKDNWTFEDGCNVTIGTGNTVIFDYSTTSHIYCNDTNSEFGNLFINKPNIYDETNIGTSSQPLQVAGNMTIYAGNYFHTNSYDIVVEGTLDIQNSAYMYVDTGAELELISDFDLLGNLIISGDVLSHSEFELETTGDMTINSGASFISDHSGGGYQYLRGNLDNSGLFELTYNSLSIASTFTYEHLSAFRIGGALSANYSGTFGDSNEFTGNPNVSMIGTGGSGIQMHTDNALYNLTIEDDTWLNSDLNVKHNLTINNGYFNVNGHTVIISEFVDIFDELRMTNSASILQGNMINFKSGSYGNVTTGTIKPLRYLNFDSGTNAQFGSASLVSLNSVFSVELINRDENASIGNLLVDSPGGGQIGPTTTQPIHITGDMSVINNNEFYVNDKTLIVDGLLDIYNGSQMTLGINGSLINNSNFTLNGALDVGESGNALIHGEFELGSTGILTIDGGSFIGDANAGSFYFLMGTLNMSNGLFEIKYDSIDIKSGFTGNITGGIIRTGSQFKAIEANTFQPSGGVVELFSTVRGGNIKIAASNYFHDLLINDDIYLFTNANINNNLTIESGVFDLFEFGLSIANDLIINGNPRMTNSANIVDVGNDIIWNSGSDSSIGNGTFNIYGDWYFNNGTDAQLGTGNTVNFVGSGSQLIYNFDENASFGNVTVNKPDTMPVWLDNSSTHDFQIDGDLTLTNTSRLQVQSNTITVDGTLDIENGSKMYLEHTGGELINNSDFTLNGELDIDGGDVLIHGEFDLESTGILTIDGGSFVYDVGFSELPLNIKGAFHMTDGLYQAPERFGVGSSANTNISGGTIRVSSLIAETAGTFQPAGGEVELYLGGGNLQCSNGNYCHNLTISNIGILYTNLLVQNNFINSGSFQMQEYELEVYNNVYINDGYFWIHENSNILTVGNDIIWNHCANSSVIDGTINVSGDWYFNDGISYPFGTGNTVNFVGSTTQNVYCMDADAAFGSVFVFKPAGDLNIHTSSTYPMHVTGNLDAIDVHSFNLQSKELIVDGSIDIYNSEVILGSDGVLVCNSGFTVNGDLEVGTGEVQVTGTMYVDSYGTLNIDGGSFICDDTVNDTSIITGDLNFSDGLLQLNGNLTFTSGSTNNISGGTIRCGHIFNVNEGTTFAPTGGVVDLTGTSIMMIMGSGTSLYDLLITGSIYPQASQIFVTNDLTVDGTLFLNDDLVQVGNDMLINGGIRMDSALDNLSMNNIYWNSGSTDNITAGTLDVSGDWYFNDGTAAQLGTGNTVNFVGSENSTIYCDDDDACFGNLHVNKADSSIKVNLDWLSTHRVAGELTIEEGVLHLFEDVRLEIGESITVQAGGIFDSWANDDPCIVTKYNSEPYAFNVESWGTIHSSSTIFEYMDAYGVNIKPDAIIGGSSKFWDCTFQNGTANGTLLTIDNYQDMILNDLTFISITKDALFNVTKNVDNGTIQFTNTMGNFAGPDYENDPYNRIEWVGFTVPTVTTDAITDLAETTATSGGNVTTDGGSLVTARGVCWSINSNPTIADDLTVDGSGIGTFVSELTELEPNTLYYVRAYATNAVGTSYGNEISFTTTTTAPPAVPQNVTIEITSENIVLTWEAVSRNRVITYKIYSSDDPNALFATWTFVEEVSNNTWSEAIPESPKFYRVTAVE